MTALSPVRSLIHEAIVAAIPDTNLTAADWADTYRTVSDGPDVGSKWKTDRQPGVRELLEAGSHVRVKEIVIGGASRWGKTEGVLCNRIGYRMHIAPAPVMMVHPKKEAAEKFSRDRLDALIRETPVLRNLVEDPRVRDSGNTRMHKVFPGGHISLVSANVPADLAAETICELLLDEIDRFPESSGEGEDSEGDPIALARKRTTQYQQTGEALIIMTSSPTIHGRSRIAQAYGATDRCEFWCPCPGCDTPINLSAEGAFQRLVKWTAIDLPASQAKFVCPECAVILDEDERLDMLYNYRWIPQSAVAAGVGHLPLWEWYSHRAFEGVAGFWFPGLASTFVTLAQMAEEVTKASRENNLLAKQVFVNTTLGELWKPWEEIEKEDLSFRTEQYKAEVPAPVVILTFAIDVQHDRVEVEVAGWSTDEERWSIDYRVFHGDPSRVEVEGETTVWDEVWDYLEREWQHERGPKLKVKVGCIDTGHHSEAVYEFCKKSRTSRWLHREDRAPRLFYWAIKGGSVPAQPIAPKKASRVGRWNVQLRTIGVNAAKDTVFAALKLGWNKEGKWVGGPGSYHWPEKAPYDDDYFAQVASERRKPGYDKRGYSVFRWELIREGIRNEAWDNLIYNFAALRCLKPNLKSYQTVLDDAVARLQQQGPGVRSQEPDDDDGGEDPNTGEPAPPTRNSKLRTQNSFRVPRRPGGYWPRRW